MNHYHQFGYRGEIGIDFGMANGRCFFLEANARENNGTRLHTQLQQQHIDEKRYEFLYMRNIPFRLMQEEMVRCGDNPNMSRVLDCGDRKLVLSTHRQEFDSLIMLLEKMSRHQPPFPY